MHRAVGFGLIAVGVVLLVLGFQAADSFASDVHKFFTGDPTDRAVWLMIGGVAAAAVGIALTVMPRRALTR
jgi:hypothetical protein